MTTEVSDLLTKRKGLSFQGESDHTDLPVKAIFSSLEGHFTKSMGDLFVSLAEHLAEVLDRDLDQVQEALSSFTGVVLKSKGPKGGSALSFAPGEVILISNYTDKAAALFGDTKSIKDTFITEFNSASKRLKYNANLTYGPGWVLPSKETDNLRKGLKKAKIPFREITREMIEQGTSEPSEPSETKAANEDEDEDENEDGEDENEDGENEDENEDGEDEDGNSEADENEDEGEDESDGDANKGKKNVKVAKGSAKISKTTKTTKAVKAPVKKATVKAPVKKATAKVVKAPAKTVKAPVKKATAKVAKTKADAISAAKTKNKTVKTAATAIDATGTAAPALTKNAWGNYEDEPSGIVLMQLPVGLSHRKINVAIGVQDPDSEDKGVASVVPLTEEMYERCEELKATPLSQEIIEKLEVKDPKVAKTLAHLVE